MVYPPFIIFSNCVILKGTQEKKTDLDGTQKELDAALA